MLHKRNFDKFDVRHRIEVLFKTSRDNGIVRKREAHARTL
jgi:hypothetical protein